MHLLNTDWPETYIQLVGFFAAIVFIVAYQIQNTRKTQILFSFGDVCYGVQYYFLGSTSASLGFFSAGVRDLFGAFASDKWLKVALVLHVFISLCLWVLYAHSWQEGLVVVSATLSSFSSFYRGQFYKFRFLLASRQIVMLIFNIWILSYGGIAMMLFTLSSNIIGIYRYRTQEKSRLEN